MSLYHNSGVGSLRSRCQQIWFLVRDNSWHGDGHFLLCPYEANGEQVSSLPLHAAAAAKSLQSCPTVCDPIDSSALGSSVPGILHARILEWVSISFSNAWKWKVKVKSLSHTQLFATPWTAAYQSPPSRGVSRQEYWSGLPLPSLSATSKSPLKTRSP